MSGTSADGVDVAIVDIRGDHIDVISFATFLYPGGLRRDILKLLESETAPIADVSHLNFVIGEVFAASLIKLAKKKRIALKSIDLIGSHGQTIGHFPKPRRSGGWRTRSTLQIGEPCVIAERTGITTVADFRPRDVAAGGEGAPLVPYADYILFRDKRASRIILNIGGIANLTYLPAGSGADDIIAFDTGPGNMVIDRITYLISNGRHSFDRGGRLGRRGKIDDRLLAELMKHKFLKRPAPKSTGREEFGVRFSDRIYHAARRRRISPYDILATVTAFTAKSIAQACRRFIPGKIDEVVASGGGSHNNGIVDSLRRELHPAEVKLTEDLGIDVDAKEAVSFAILAYATVQNMKNNVPSATGARDGSS